MSRYEAKLKTGNIFDHNFPDAASTIKKIDLSNLKHPLPAADTDLLETLLAEYNVCLDYLKPIFKEYEATVEKWFTSLSIENKKLSADYYLFPPMSLFIFEFKSSISVTAVRFN
jgi:hypothetical protein